MLKLGNPARLVALIATLSALILIAPAGASAKIKMGVPGWSTFAGATTPQVKNNKTIKACHDMSNGQRTLRVIFRGSGIKKNTKVGIGVWGGPASAGFSTEPTKAEIKTLAFKWPVAKGKTYQGGYGYSWANTGFGPQDINGEWHAKILVDGKLEARGHVTVAC